MNLLRQSPRLQHWLLRSQRALLVAAALLAFVLSWFYVDLLNEQVQRGESTRERLRTSALRPADAVATRLIDAKGRAALRLGSGMAAATYRLPRSTP